jgi:hypothetical protein
MIYFHYQSKSNTIISVGITQRERQILNSEAVDPPRVPFANDQPTFDHRNANVYFTVGSLRSIRKSETRRVGPRLTGMSIIYYDGTIDILGHVDVCSRLRAIFKKSIFTCPSRGYRYNDAGVVMDRTRDSWLTLNFG